ncbi:OmpA family protein [Aliikangiella maris]|uniref:OmpA family protein n=2 Tax=Aliikangiella maris TaxID=3162458 RepID=A0ABV3ML16_9GAMM
MKKMTIISTLVITSVFHSFSANAASSKEENIGFASGAIAGAAIGGPVGFIIGGVTGLLVGEQVEKANQVDEITNQLAQSNQREQALKQQVSSLNSEMALLAEAEQVTLPEGLTLNLMFTTNSAELSDLDHKNIAQLASILIENPQLTVQLDGYADPRGSKADNLKLSQHRVDAVKQALQSFGVNQDQLVSAAHGEIDYGTPTTNNDNYALARKVSINFIQSHSSELNTEVAQY